MATAAAPKPAFATCGAPLQEILAPDRSGAQSKASCFRSAPGAMRRVVEQTCGRDMLFLVIRHALAFQRLRTVHCGARRGSHRHSI
eukprot:scaffold7966_cov277-Pinguiococcus_pyrenoidosus.AAC.3